jgi:hypothetical protein
VVGGVVSGDCVGVVAGGATFCEGSETLVVGGCESGVTYDGLPVGDWSEPAAGVPPDIGTVAAPALADPDEGDEAENAPTDGATYPAPPARTGDWDPEEELNVGAEGGPPLLAESLGSGAGIGRPRAAPADATADCTGPGSESVAAAAVPADSAPTTTTMAAALGMRQDRTLDRARAVATRAGAVRARLIAGTVGEPHPDIAGATPPLITPTSVAIWS